MNDPRATTPIDKAIFAASVITRANAHHQCVDDAAPKRNVVMVRMISMAGPAGRYDRGNDRPTPNSGST